MDATSTAATSHAEEVTAGGRFEFGRNWQSFTQTVDEQRIVTASESMATLLRSSRLEGKTLIDIGCGSGIFSLAARRLGASVRAFDYDGDSCSCSEAMRATHRPGDKDWQIERGSILDDAYISKLGRYDIVYSWGVLHHTGNMWKALANAATLVAPSGSLYIAIYNNQGLTSQFWTCIKYAFNKWRILRPLLILGFFFPLCVGRRLVRGLFGRGRLPRGMSLWHDMIDWLGGYPFETATPHAIVDFFYERGFLLSNLRTCGGRAGCNEFVFVKK